MPEKLKKEVAKAEEGGTLVTAAKTIGKAAGKIASLAGAHLGPPPRSPGKLPKKNKSRLPRRQKKAMRRAGSAPVM